MIYSSKTLLLSAVLLASSLLIVGLMHIHIFNGADGFEIMESSFNSLRKGVKPPFKKIEDENKVNLGKNINITLGFRDNTEARIVTMMFLRNKLTVTPKGRTINIQGDLGYTLKFFMNDIYLLYMNRFKELEARYSISPISSMYFLNRILQKMAIAMAKQNMDEQEKLIVKIREKLLVPAYNLREALPVSETSGFLSITLGTFGILIFAILWDLSNFLFFGTLASENFMKSLRIMLGRQLSDADLKKLAIRKKKMAKAMQDRKRKAEQQKKVEGTKTNREALRKLPEPKIKSEKAATTKKKIIKKKNVYSEGSAGEHETRTDPVKPDAQQQEKNIKKKPPIKQKLLQKESVDTTPKAKVRKTGNSPTPRHKSDEQNKTAGKPVKKVTDKKSEKSTSQTQNKKVTTQQGRKKAAAKPKPESGNKPDRTSPPAVKKKPVKPKQAAQKGIKPDEQ
ncbi:hypothetical protein [Maridesulfovibrio sp.]|uniref:hypothetical protein n=1 Tax=Maridesulfovibrio sp. TaxID=2795000 RepID=UPI0039F0656A